VQYNKFKNLTAADININLSNKEHPIY